MTGFADHRRQLDERRGLLARAVAKPMIAEWVRSAETRSDFDLENEICLWIGKTLADRDYDAPVEDYIGPNILAGAVIGAAADAVAAALAGETDDPMSAWRVLNAAASIVNHPLSDQAASSMEELRVRSGGRLVPKTPSIAVLTGPVLWTRDGYGSRFGIVAPFRTTDGAQRWYLWDVDACGHGAFTVHSGYHATPEEALADWQGGVGVPAADGTVLTPVDDPWTLDELMPRELGLMRPGGENAEQFAEYHRSKRLAEAVLEAIEPAGPDRIPTPEEIDRTTAASLFTAWLREHRPDRSRQADLEELATELADSWQINGPPSLYRTCSPHRVALVAEHVSGYYEEEFAADLVALLPDWTAWLAHHNATPPHLADRCSRYVHGQQHQAVHVDDRGPNYLVRIGE